MKNALASVLAWNTAATMPDSCSTGTVTLAVEPKSSCTKEERKNLMNDFKRVMYSTSMVEADSLVCNTDDEAMNSPFSRHVAKLYERKEERVMACRYDIINRSHNTNNYAEATLRIVKDIILTRLKAYNSLALLDYVVVVLEKYYCGRLLNAAFGRLEKSYLLYQKIADKGAEIIQSQGDAVLLVDDEHYQVASDQLDGTKYDVRCDVGCC